MWLRALVISLLAVSLASPGIAEAKRKVRPRRLAPVPATVPLGASGARDTADGDDVPRPAAAAAPAAAATGGYKGVRPGKVELPPNPPKAKGAPYLTWSGFMMTDHGSRVFLQFTQTVQYSVAESPKTVVVTIKGARIYKRNNARPVNTRFFATPVLKVQARQRGKDIRVTIALRKPAKPELKLEAGEGGYQFLMLDFPPAGDSAATAPRP